MQQPIDPQVKKPPRKRTKNPAGKVVKDSFLEGWQGAKASMGDALTEGISNGISNLANALMNRGISAVTERVGGVAGIQDVLENPEEKQRFPPWMDSIINGPYAVVTCVGPRDSGKTTVTVAIAEARQHKFGTSIYFINYPASLAPEHIIPVHASEMMRLMEVAEPGSTIIIDDASIIVNSKRTMTDSGIGFENLVNTVAHRGIMLAINVQDTSDLNKAGLRADLYMLKDPDPEFLHTERPRMRVIMQHAILAFANIPEEDKVKYVYAWASGRANGMVEIIRPEWLTRDKVKYHGQTAKEGGFDPKALDSRIVEGEYREVDAPIRNRQADHYDDGVGPLV